MKKIILFCLILAAAITTSAQIETIYNAESGRVVRNKLNGNFAYLDSISSDLGEAVAADAERLDSLLDAGIQTVKISVSSAEILQLFTTPKVLIAAPGVNKLIQIIGNMVVWYNYGGEYYNNVIGVAIKFGVDRIHYLSTIGGASSAADISGGGQVFGDVSNQPVTLISPQNPTDGNGSLEIFLTYRVINVGN